MPLEIEFPAKNEILPPQFAAYGTYEYPGDLTAVLFRVLPRPHFFLGTAAAGAAGTWVFSFNVGTGPFGKYILAVADPSRGVLKHIPVTVKKLSASSLKKMTLQQIPPPFYPTTAMNSPMDCAQGCIPAPMPVPPGIVVSGTVTFSTGGQSVGNQIIAPTFGPGGNGGLYLLQFTTLIPDPNSSLVIRDNVPGQIAVTDNNIVIS